MTWSKESQERWKSAATIVSLLAVPLVLALGTWFIQRSIAAESVKQQYVGLAIGILREPTAKDDEEAEELRRWAIGIVDLYAPKRLTRETKLAFASYRVFEGRGDAYKDPEFYLSTCEEKFAADNDKQAFDACVRQREQFNQRWRDIFEDRRPKPKADD